MSGAPIFSFPPVVDHDSRVLIVGSMPGAESLRRRQYYAHPRNAFWSLMARLLDEPLASEYSARTAMLLKNRIALWDVVGSCLREGSLDQNIRDPEPNDFGWLFGEYPGIRRVFCNGTKAWELFRKVRGLPPELEFLRLPSTSPAHAVAFDVKLAAWRAVTAALDEAT